MGRLIFKTLVGCTAALLAWAIIEPTKPALMGDLGAFTDRMLLTLGVFAGIAIGGLSGYSQGSRTHMIRGMVLGGIFGFVGIRFGTTIGALLGGNGGQIPGEPLPVTIFKRVLGVTPIGAFLGLAIGGSSLTLKRAIQGLIGGTLGGLTAGLTFDIVAISLQPISLQLANAQPGQTVEIGGFARAVSFTILGGAIALFIALVEQLSKSAWLRLRLGKNEGKEWVLDTNRTFIGRHERATVPLMGDPNVSPTHAVIDKQNGQYILSDGGSPMGTVLNGQRIGQAVLVPGSIIQIGSYTLEFMTRNSPAPKRGPESYGAGMPIQGNPYMAPQPTQMGVGFPQPQQPPMGQPQGQPPVGMAPTQAFTPPSGMQPTMAFGTQPASAPSTASLVALDGPMVGQRFPINGSILLGRESPTVPMSYDVGASRRHASVEVNGFSAVVKDLGSKNGTQLNGQTIATQADLKPNDILKIGATSFRFETV